MGIGASEEIANKLRNQLSIIHAQTELLLEQSDSSSADRHASLHRIVRTCYEINSIITADQPAALEQAFPSDNRPVSVDRTLLLSHNTNLAPFFDNLSQYQTGVDIHFMASETEAKKALSTSSFDSILVDAVWENGTGLDILQTVLADVDSPHPYGIISFFSSETTPLGLGISGIISPQVSGQTLVELTDIFQHQGHNLAVSSGVPEIFTSTIAEHVPGELITLSDHPATPKRALDTNMIFLTAAEYAQLSGDEIESLRTVTPGRGRALICVDSTDNDLSGRDWIPTIGSQRFLHTPPDLVTIVVELLAQRDPETTATRL